MLEIAKLWLPIRAEWDQLADVVDSNNDLMHWKGIFSWCQDVYPDWPSHYVVQGYSSASHRSHDNKKYRSVSVGFRPAVELRDPGNLPDGAIVTIGTLYMDGQPVKIPKDPTWDGDIPNYVTGTKLELRRAIQDAAYQIPAIKVGNTLIADRVLLKRISWNDLHKQGIC